MQLESSSCTMKSEAASIQTLVIVITTCVAWKIIHNTHSPVERKSVGFGIPPSCMKATAKTKLHTLKMCPSRRHDWVHVSRYVVTLARGHGIDGNVLRGSWRHSVSKKSVMIGSVVVTLGQSPVKAVGRNGAGGSDGGSGGEVKGGGIGGKNPS